MAGGFPQLSIDQQRRPDLDVSGCIQFAAQVLFQGLVQGPAFRMPEHLADGFVLDVEEIELASELAVIALFGFLDHAQVRLQLVLVGKRQAVDALQLRVLRITAPVRARDLGQLERFTELAGGRHVRAQAHVEPVVALAIDGQGLVRVEPLADPFGLERFAVLFEERDRLVVRPLLARDRQVALDDLAHLFLDLFQIRLGERLLAREVVVEAGLGRRAKSDLRTRKQFLHRLRHHMRRVVSNRLQRFGLGRA